jgi:hypothetical protein
MRTSIAAEQRNEYGAVLKKHQPRQRGHQSSRSAKKPKVDVRMDHESDPDDGDFTSDGSSMERSEADREATLYRIIRYIERIHCTE